MTNKEKLGLSQFQDMMELCVTHLYESEKYCNNKRVKKVKGWLLPSIEACNGEGCLITFTYINKKNPSDIRFYAMSDEEIVGYIYLMITALRNKEKTFNMNELLTANAYMQLLVDYKLAVEDINDWDVRYLIKGYYEGLTTKEHGLSHLSISENLTHENLLSDMKKMRMRGVNLAQLTAEACLVFMANEDKAEQQTDVNYN